MEVKFQAAPAVQTNFIGTVVDKMDQISRQAQRNVASASSKPSRCIHPVDIAVTRQEAAAAQTVLPDVVKTVPTQPLFVNRPLPAIAQCGFEKKKTSHIGFYCSRFTKIVDELWCTKFDSTEIHVLDLEFKEKRKLRSTNICICRTVAQIGNGLVVATSQGLYRSNMDGTGTVLIARGGMADMCWEDKLGYILNDKCRQVCVVEYDECSDSFTQRTDIALATYNEGAYNTIQITKEHIFITEYDYHRILKLKKTGEFVSSYGSYGSANKQLHSPLLCGADIEGSLLTADQWNDRLQILAPDGTWQSLRIDGICKPHCVFIDHYVLYVAHDIYISKYTMRQ